MAADIDTTIPEPPRTIDEIDDNFPEYFAAIEDEIDEIIPTRAKRINNQVGGNAITPREQLRLRALRDLWDYAEECKIKISQNETIQPPPVGNRISELVAKALAQSADSIRWDADWDNDVIKELVRRLIQEEVTRIVSSANNLISELESRLRSLKQSPNDQVPPFLHHVYLVGQGALYPLMANELKAHLQVPFLGEPAEVQPDGLHPRFVFDRQHLKGAVARGAALLRMSELSERSVKVIYDEDLSQRLPFSIGYDPDQMATVVLFKEHERYGDLGIREIKASLPTEGTTITLVLRRNWPGSNQWEPFLSFEFTKTTRPGNVRASRRRMRHLESEPESEPMIRIEYSSADEFAQTLGFKAEIDDGSYKCKGQVMWRQPNVSPLESGEI